MLVDMGICHVISILKHFEMTVLDEPFRRRVENFHSIFISFTYSFCKGSEQLFIVSHMFYYFKERLLFHAK